MTVPTIRMATVADLDRIMAVMTAGFDPQWSEAWTRTQARTLFLVPGQAVWIAERDDVPVGFAAARAVADESELLLIAVDPAARRQGIASALIRGWLDWAFKQGCAATFLEVRDNNDAIGLYRRHGFEECGRRPGYYNGVDGTQRDAITMRRDAAQ